MADVPQLVPYQRLNLTIVSAHGVHALRTQLHGQPTADERLVVLWPMEELRLFPIRAGQVVIIEHSRPGDAHYTREMSLEAASTEEPPTLILAPLSDWRRVQRREAPRVEVMPRPISARRRGSDGTCEDFEARPTDLSNGGVRLASSLELRVDDRIDLTFGRADGPLCLDVQVAVIRSQRASSDRDEWEVACRFVEPAPQVREALVGLLLALIRTASD